jgi:hypothetical protein
LEKLSQNSWEIREDFMGEGGQVSRVFISSIDRDVRIIKFRGDSSRLSGIVEVRGIVNKDGSMSFGEFTQYDNEFGK